MGRRSIYFKGTPKNILRQINEIEVRCQILREEVEKAQRNHRKVNMDNGTYDPIAYNTFQIAIHNDILRAGLIRVRDEKPTILANGTELAW